MPWFASWPTILLFVQLPRAWGPRAASTCARIWSGVRLGGAASSREVLLPHSL